MTKHQIEAITSVERRRRWSREEAGLARRKSGWSRRRLSQAQVFLRSLTWPAFHVSQLFRWRKELCQISAPSVPQLISVEVVDPLPVPPTPAEPPSVPRSRKKTSMVTIELGGGRRLRVESDIDTEALARILDVLERR
ncbi:hypothetical protein Q1M63_02905 (plasmid) [Sinorhizobium meliloti]|nr:hypothetical protein LZK74_02580 [Sinorhizobium meliloti]WKL24477.1 hypothetical protein Q1M63_02905 [Sinorhizobium meliloti]